jgi:hypothetical protein
VAAPAPPPPVPSPAARPAAEPAPVVLPQDVPVPVAAPALERPLDPAVVGDDPAPVAGNGAVFGGTPLTRRVPQASLDPRMRTVRQPSPSSSTGSGLGGRSPEQLRAQLSTFQAAQARARRETSDSSTTTVNGQEHQ